MTRVVVLGLDAAPSTLIDEEIRAGRLPHLAALRADAATAALTDPDPFRAEMPWTEFVTGRRATSLRYWSTLHFEPETYTAFLRGAVDADPFYAFGDDTSVVAFDLPKVVRRASIRGVQALGWGAHSPQYPPGSIPDGILGDLVEHVGPHPALPIEYAGTWNQPQFLVRFGAAQAAGARLRVDALRRLAATVPDWQLLLTLFSESHQTGHVTYHGFGGLLAGAPSAGVARTTLHTVLRAIDDAVGAIRTWAPDDAAVVVFSTQGMGPGDDDTAATLAPELLLRSGTGETRRRGGDLEAWRRAGAPPRVPSAWEHPAAITAREIGSGAVVGSLRERARAALWSRAPGVARARRRLLRLEPTDAGALSAPFPTTYPYRDHSINDWHPAASYQDAWPRLPAFVIPSFSDVHVRINLAGRERDGIVAPEEYDAACTAVEEAFAACRDARTGGPAVRRITRMRADDPLAPDGPPADLVVACAPCDAWEHPVLGSFGPAVALRTGSHTTDGFAYVAGPGIVPGPRGPHETCDVSATICALIGRTPAGGLDGRSILAPGEGR